MALTRPNKKQKTGLQLHLDVFTTCFDGGLNSSTGMIDLDAPNRYRKAWTEQKKTVRPAKERAHVMMHQCQKVVHFQFSKTQAEDRDKLVSRLKGALGNKLPVDNYVPRLPGTKMSLKNMDYMCAPAVGSRAYRLKRGMIVIQLLDPITQEAPRVTAHGVSSYFGTHCLNGLPFYTLHKFLGISQTESKGDDFLNVREDCTAATSGTDKILNNSGLSIPLSVYIYYSRMPYVTTDDHGRIIPVINTDTGPNGAGIYGQTFLPAIFYLTDNSIFSLEERITEQLTIMLGESEAGLDLKTDGFHAFLAAFNEKIAEICDQRCTTYELRQDFVLYELAVLKAYKMVMERVDTYNWHSSKLGREGYADALRDTVHLGIRALSFFGRERAEIVVDEYNGFFAGNNESRYVLSSQFLYGNKALNEKLKDLNDIRNDTNKELEEIIEHLLIMRYWINQRVEKAINLSRAEGIKLLKNRYVGISREAAEPGEWFEIEINA